MLVIVVNLSFQGRDQLKRTGPFREPQARFFQCEFPDEGLQLGMLSCQAGVALALLMDLKGFGGMGQKWVAPLIILGLAQLMLRTNLRDGLPFRPSITIIALRLASYFRRCMADPFHVSHRILSSWDLCLHGEQYM